MSIQYIHQTAAAESKPINIGDYPDYIPIFLGTQGSRLVNWISVDPLVVSTVGLNYILFTVSSIGAAVARNVVIPGQLPAGSLTANSSTSDMALTIDKVHSQKYELIQSVPIVIKVDGDGYVAEFRVAEITTSGDTASEALEWMRDAILARFELYRTERDALGPLPKRQLEVLEGYIAQKHARTA